MTLYGLNAEDRAYVKKNCLAILHEISKRRSDGAYIGEKAKKILDTCMEQ